MGRWSVNMDCWISVFIRMRTECRWLADDTRFVIYSGVRRGVRGFPRVLMTPAGGGGRVTPRGSVSRLIGEVSAFSFRADSECDAAVLAVRLVLARRMALDGGD